MRRRLLAALLLLLVYYGAGRAGLSLAYVHLSATAIWAPTGIALAALLVWGRSLWPVVLLGAFLVNVTTSGAPGVSAAIAVGNTLEALIGASLIERYAQGARAFERTADTVRFAVLAAFSGTVVSASVGVTSLALAGLASWQNYAAIWFTWWLGDAAGALLVAPPLVLWATQPSLGWDRRQAAEALALLFALLLMFGVVFAGRTVLSTENYPLSFLALPLVAWAALRFGPREVSLLGLLLSLLAIGGTLRGLGPFGRRSPNESLLLLQAFSAVVAASGLILATTVAERRRLAHTLRDSEERYRIMAETASDAIVSIDRDSRITYVNAAVQRLFGYRADELLGRELTMLMPERLRARHRASLAEYVASGVRHLPWNGIELPGLHKDGHEIAVEVSFGEYRRDGAHVFIGIVRDITARKRAEEQQSWLASIIESSDDAIVSKTLDGTVTSWNAAAEQLFGYRAGEMIGQSIMRIVPAYRVDEEEQILQQLRRGERVKHFDTVRRCKDGSLIEVALTLSPVRDANGTVKGASTIARDISERRRLAHLQQRAIQLEAENRAALEIARSKSAFLSRMSHELRTPLNGVLGFAQLLLAGGVQPDSPKVKGYMQQILLSGRQLLGFIDALLDLAAVESNRLEFHPEALNLGAVLSELAALSAAQAADKQIVLSHAVEPGLEEVRLDPVRLKQVLQALLSNALKFTPAQGRVSLRAAPEGEQGLRIEVQDSGPGIAEPELSRLFMEFQNNPAAAGNTGSGISLALARKLVQAQGGEIRVDSQPGQGSIFRVVLPRTHALS
jgi:PAS domain S-box-containing protein